MHSFKADIHLIGINPFVFVPINILNNIFEKAGKNKGNIPIRGVINGSAYTQTLVKYQGDWRLYINTTMLKNSPGRIGEIIELTIEYDPADRSYEMHPKLTAALSKNLKARETFERLSPSTRKEIIRYISRLKTETTIDKNVEKAISFLLGKGRFVGRESLK